MNSLARRALASYAERRAAGDFDDAIGGGLEKMAFVGSAVSAAGRGAWQGIQNVAGRAGKQAGKWWQEGEKTRAEVATVKRAGKVRAAQDAAKRASEIQKAKRQQAVDTAKRSVERKAELLEAKHARKLERVSSGEGVIGGFLRRRREAKEAALAAAEAQKSSGWWKVPAAVGGAAAAGGLAYGLSRPGRQPYVPANYR
jgi:hypothetical protein